MFAVKILYSAPCFVLQKVAVFEQTVVNFGRWRLWVVEV